MDNLQIEQLTEKQDLLLEKASRFENEGNYDEAIETYKKAIEVMLDIAELSTKKYARAKVDRAKKIGSKIEKLEKQKNAEAYKENKKENKTTRQSKSEDEGKMFVGAKIPNVKFSDVVGLEDAKEEARLRMIYPLKYPDIYKKYRKKMGGGMLLYGPPGTGKTMFAKAIANEVGATFYAIKGSDIVSKWVGESEQNINRLFVAASEQELSIIYIDEIDYLLRKRGDDYHNDGRVNEFLQQMDGFASDNSKILFLGATNHPWEIDSAAMRSGRFSVKIFVPFPNKEARKLLFEKELKGLPLSSDVNLDVLVEKSERLGGADICGICDIAKNPPIKDAIEASTKGGKMQMREITMTDFEYAFSSAKSPISDEELQKYIDYANSFGIKLNE